MSEAPKIPPAPFQGKKNLYTCEACHGHIVTVDVDDGVTPFMVGCKATAGCKGLMKSSMYRVFDQSMKASHEWYRPSASRAATMSPAVREHVRNGGLLIREAKS